MIEKLDCTTCGACCAIDSTIITWAHKPIENSDENLNFLKINNYIDSYIHGYFQMKTSKNCDRCIALEGTLGEKVSCNVYENRPSVCKNFEIGSKLCLDARSKFLEQKSQTK
jgi:uncharacterized protein